MDLQRGVTVFDALALTSHPSSNAESAVLELENGRDLDSTTSKERSPRDQVNGTTNDESSPQSSPKRKPSVPRRGQGVQKPRLNTDRKPTLRSLLWNSVKKTVKRNSVVGPSSRGSVDVEASDFSFRQPPRGSPVSGSHKKKGSPSLELHSGKRRSRSSLAIEVRPVTVGRRSSEASLYDFTSPLVSHYNSTLSGSVYSYPFCSSSLSWSRQLLKKM